MGTDSNSSQSHSPPMPSMKSRRNPTTSSGLRVTDFLPGHSCAIRAAGNAKGSSRTAAHPVIALPDVRRIAPKWSIGRRLKTTHFGTSERRLLAGSEPRHTAIRSRQVFGFRSCWPASCRLGGFSAVQRRHGGPLPHAASGEMSLQRGSRGRRGEDRLAGPEGADRSRPAAGFASLLGLWFSTPRGPPD